MTEHETCPCPKTDKDVFDDLRTSCLRHFDAAKRCVPFEGINTPVTTLLSLAWTLAANARFGEAPNDLVDTLECLVRELDETPCPRNLVPAKALVYEAFMAAKAMARDAESRDAAEMLDEP